MDVTSTTLLGPSISSGMESANASPTTTSLTPTTISTTSDALPVSSSTANSTTSGTSAKSNGVSAGAAAGIGIGCAIAGALIAAAVLLLLLGFRRKRKLPRVSKPTAARTDRIDMDEMPSTGGRGRIVAGPMSARVSNFESLLPLPDDDTYLGRELSGLNTGMRNHANNFFHFSIISPAEYQESINQDGLTSAVTTSLTSAALMARLANPNTREEAIILVLASAILGRLDSSQPPAGTLLPAGIAACTKAMSGPSSRDAAYNELLSKWRVMTGYLQHHTYVDQAWTQDDDRLRGLEETSRSLDSLLGPLVRADRNRDRQSNLVELIKRAAQFGNTLQAQPSSWAFNWRPSSKDAEAGAVVIFPALMQLTSDDGQPLSRPRMLGQRETAFGGRR